MTTQTLRSEATFSGAKRWLNCPGSVALSRGAPEDPDQSWREEGIAAHAIACNALRYNFPLDDIHPLKTPKTDEEKEDAEKMLRAVKIYVDYVRSMAGPGPLVVEERLSVLGTSGGIDCYAVRNKIAHLFDYKHGRGVKRRAEGDEQLAGYALLIKEAHPEVTLVVAHMIQPNLPGLFEDVPSITSWTLPWQTIRKWKSDFEVGLLKVEEAKEIHAGSWCQFCRAMAFCPAYLAMTERAKADQETIIVPLDDEDEEEPTGELALRDYAPAEISRIANLFSMRKFVERWFEKAQAFLLAQLKAGIEVPGFLLGEGRSNRIWTTGMTEEQVGDELLVRGVPQEELYKRSFIRITRAEEFCDVSDLTEKPKGKDTIKVAKALPAPKKKRAKKDAVKE